MPHRGIIIMKLLNKIFWKTYAFHPYLNYPQTNFNKIILLIAHKCTYLKISTPRPLYHEQDIT